MIIVYTGKDCKKIEYMYRNYASFKLINNIRWMV